MTDVAGTFEAAVRRTEEIEKNLALDPSKYRVLTGERPTGPLHIGHFFGTLKNRVRLQSLGVETWIVIADYQVLTDRDSSNHIKTNIIEILADYLSIGLNPFEHKTIIFNHSSVPSLNQLLIPF